VEKGSTLMTDEDRSFVGMDGHFRVQAVNHSAGEYARMGNWVHTNSMESVWALFKRKIIGIHHWVSDKHLQRYVDELAWAYNRRDMKPAPRMNTLFECVEGRPGYKVLIGKTFA
jgi:hypothetical protein